MNGCQISGVWSAEVNAARGSLWLRMVRAMAVVAALWSPATVQAQRLAAPRILPETTVGYVRIGDVQELRTRFRDTAMGRILKDEQVRPFVEHLYGSLLDAFTQVQDRVGASLDELLNLPQGEFCVALVAPEQGMPQVVLIVDVGDRQAVAEKLLTRMGEEMTKQGATREATTAHETEIVTYQMPGERRRRQVATFIRDKTAVLASDPELAKQLLSVWNGNDEVRTLADNRQFTAIMSKCAGAEAERPLISWFLDPLELARKVTRGNFNAQAMLTLLDSVGLDGVQAVGGTILLPEEEYDGVMHTHLLLQTPREGLVNMIALRTGDTTPEPWTPHDAASYVTVHWDFDRTYQEIAKLFDKIRGEGAWQREVVDRVGQQLELKLQEDIITAAAGRLTLVTWMERPARINSQSTMLGIQLKDAAQTRQHLDRVMQRFSGQFTRENYGATSYYRQATPRTPPNFDQQFMRLPQPCFCILGDYLLITDSPKLLEQAVITQADSSAGLAKELDFKLISGKIQRQLGDLEAGLLSFNRPEEGMRLMYELATSQATKDRLAAGNNPVFKALHRALQERPLPAFSVLAKYLAPGGAMATDDETGLHYTAFGLRRD